MADAKKPTTADDLDALMEATEKAAEVRLHPILTNEQVLEARSKARKAVDAQRVAAAMKEEERKETSRLAREEGLTTGIGYLEELVHIAIDLPRSAPCISVNGGTRAFWHGHGYDVPRHVANSLSESMYRCWAAEEQADGKSRYDILYKPRHTAINGMTGAVGVMH
jgi:hypothetical protein